MTSVLPCCNSGKALPSFSVLLKIILQLIPRLHHGARKKKIASCLWDGIKCNEDTSHVIRLDLTSSCLHGSINSSSSLFQLVHLEWLVLSNNHFNFSEIPSEIKNLSRLTALSLSNSSFSGQIPAELLELSKLESLDLSFNNFHLKLQSLK